MARTVCICASPSELADESLRRIAAAARQAIDARGQFTLCLPGGDTPRETLGRLVSLAPEEITWKQVHIFWGDERCIPLERPDNHFTMASDLLLDHVPIPSANVHRVRGEATDPAWAAVEYETELRRFFRSTKDQTPTFDLVVLGMGEDGHVASIFPGSEGERETDRWVVDHWVTKRGERLRRLSLTLPVLSAARSVMVLVSGAVKAKMLAAVLEEGSDVPAGHVDTHAADVVWIADAEAGCALRNPATAAGAGP